MRFNDKELLAVAAKPGDKEGRMHYKSRGGFREGYKERWFKLSGNLLFYFRLNEHGAVYEAEPVGVIVIEQCRVRSEEYTEFPNAFSLTFVNDFEKRHYFGCDNQKQKEDWISSLNSCSYANQRVGLKELQEELHQKTGRDPLTGIYSCNLKPTIEQNDSDAYFNNVHSFSKSNGEFVSLL